MGAQITTPAHTHCGEYCNVISGCHAVTNQFWNQTDCSASCTQRGNRNRNALRACKSEQWFQDKVQFIAQSRQQSNTFISCTGIGTCFGRTIGQHHNKGTDNQNTRNNSYTHADTGFSAIQHCGHETGSCATRTYHTVIGIHNCVDTFYLAHLCFAVFFCCKHQHQTYTDNTSNDCTQVTNQCRTDEALSTWRGNTDHKGSDNQTHTKCSTDVSQCWQLISLKISAETLVISQSQNCRVIGQIGCQNTNDACTWQIVQRFHQWRKYLIDNRNDTELCKQT